MPRASSGRCPLRSAAVLLVATLVLGAGAPGALANPVLPGDHADPSLLRAGSGWYAATTSNSWLPAFPILRSTDLRSWRQVGAVLERRPAWAADDFWAPELLRRGGRVLAYYAALGRDRRRCVAVASAPHLRGPYQDHGPVICSDIGEIDPLPVTDEHGGHWLLWKQNGNAHGLPTPILAAPLTPGGLSLGAPPRELFRADAPWERGLVEGPAMLRHEGMFYLVYSAGRCCGLACNYMTGVARSRSLLGPWEKRPEPLLGDDATFRCPGHGSIAGGPGGMPVFAYHAYARDDSSSRQLMIAQLRFGPDGWPVVDPAGSATARPQPVRVDFERRRLDQEWQWPVGPRPAARVAGGRLVLGPGVFGRQAGTTTFAAQALLAERRRGARAGLAVMASARNGIGVEVRGGDAVAWRVDGGRVSRVGEAGIGRGGPVALRTVVGAHVSLAVRGPHGWRRIGRAEPPPRWTHGPRVSLRVTGPARGRAHFDALWIRPH